MPWREELKLIPEVAAWLGALPPGLAADAQELRLYAGRAPELVAGGRVLARGERLDDTRLQEQVAALAGYALYRCEGQLAQGYLPLDGGHRAGVCGRMVRQEDGSWRMAEVTSVCVRIRHDCPGASRPIRAHLQDSQGRVRRVLLLGPPGCGKTTMLRDAALVLSDERGVHVAVVDEREELFPGALSGRGKRLDVLSGCSRAQGFAMLLRAMAPQAIVTDELGGAQDAAAVQDAARCGVGLLASAHAEDWGALRTRPALRHLAEGQAFERYVLLDRPGCVAGIRDTQGRRLDGD